MILSFLPSIAPLSLLKPAWSRGKNVQNCLFSGYFSLVLLLSPSSSSLFPSQSIWNDVQDFPSSIIFLSFSSPVLLSSSFFLSSSQCDQNSYIHGVPSVKIFLFSPLSSLALLFSSPLFCVIKMELYSMFSLHQNISLLLSSLPQPFSSPLLFFFCVCDQI